MDSIEWLNRCAAQYQKRGGLTEVEAKQAALLCLESCDPIDAEDFADNPEDAADEDMSYWTDDGDE